MGVRGDHIGSHRQMFQKLVNKNAVTPKTSPGIFDHVDLESRQFIPIKVEAA